MSRSIRTNNTATMQWLSAKGANIVNESGQRVILKGVGLGNWFVHEGYMWCFGGGWDRPRRIRKLVSILAGRSYATKFWNQFLDGYITEADLWAIKSAGFDSVRLPLDAQLLMDEDPTKIEFLEEGFQRIDWCLRTCAKIGLYVILDLHCAPGGQTGQNIDNCIDDFPRLFTDKVRWRQTIALWEEIARRYANEPAVAMFDLINEPVAPKFPVALRSKLIQFYRECIAAIRAIDKRHLISIEGAAWATHNGTFVESFDPQMVIHCHCYGDLPGWRTLERWNTVRDRLNAPVILGETGENEPEWVTAILTQAVNAGYSFNFWCWKKMGRRSPAIVKSPNGWDKITCWTTGGPAPEPDEAQAIFNEYLKNMQYSNCAKDDRFANGIFRRAPFNLRATDFDPATDSFCARNPISNVWLYRDETGIEIVELDGVSWEHGPVFDSRWEVFGVRLKEGDFVSYSALDFSKGKSIEIVVAGDNGSTGLIVLSLNGTKLTKRKISATKPTTICLNTTPRKGGLTLRVECIGGTVLLREVRFL